MSVEIRDGRFTEVVGSAMTYERLAEGFLFLEGPLWDALHRRLLFSDIPADTIYEWNEVDGVKTLRAPSGKSNGLAFDLDGQLLCCEHATSRLTRIEVDGGISVLAHEHRGRELNSPNDVVVRSDGTVYFTDPSYGIEGYYEGFAAEPEQAAQHVFKLDPITGTLSIAVADMQRPNGLAFSPDERMLYVSDTGNKTMRAFDVADDGQLSNSREFATCTVGGFDGFRLDEHGHIWSSAGDGVHVLHPDGTLIGKVKVPEGVANVQWGGYKRNRLYICATSSLYAVLLTVRGAKTL